MREVLGHDMISYWISIMSVLNLIVPRPDEEEHNRDVAAQRSMALKSNSLHDYNKELASNMHNPNKPRSFLDRIVGSGKDLGGDDPGNKALKGSQENASNMKSAHQSINLVPFRRNSEYGKPQFGLSWGSWALLVHTRETVEEITYLLGLDVPFYSEATAPEAGKKGSEIHLELRTAPESVKQKIINPHDTEGVHASSASSKGQGPKSPSKSPALKMKTGASGAESAKYVSITAQNTIEEEDEGTRDSLNSISLKWTSIPLNVCVHVHPLCIPCVSV
jgi:hypothetical protein